MDHPSDIPVEDFRRAGARAIDWIARYLSHPQDYPVLARVHPNELKTALPRSAPQTGEPIDAILDDFEELIVPGITHWNHPGFFAYFSITGSAPGILGELLSSALNVNGMLWQTSPAATELEEVAVDWLRQLLGLSEGFEGVIMDTASVSTLCAIAAARHALADLEIRERGMAGRADLPRLCLYTSEQAHSSVEKAAIVLGLGKEGVRKIAVDDAFRMNARIKRRGTDPSASSLPSARPQPPASIRFPPSPKSASARASGSMWTPPMPAQRRLSRSTDTSSTAATPRCRLWSIPTSGCSPPSTAASSTRAAQAS
jgi:hypothetical protein